MCVWLFAPLSIETAERLLVAVFVSCGGLFCITASAASAAVGEKESSSFDRSQENRFSFFEIPPRQTSQCV